MSTRMLSGLKLSTRDIIRLYDRLAEAGLSVSLHVDSQWRHDDTVVAWSRSRKGSYRVLTARRQQHA